MTTFAYIVLLVSIGAFPATKIKKASSFNKEQLFIPRGVTAFGDDLLKNILESTRTGENILISPFNAYSALALAHLGAAGNTQKELQNVLGVLHHDHAHEINVHRSVGELVAKLEHKAEKSAFFTEAAFANGVFIQDGYAIKPTYLEVARRVYRAEPTHVNFAENPYAATNTVNEWVSNKTKNRIPKLYRSPIEPSTLVLLTCALYFSGKWAEVFPEFKTKRDEFETENGEKIGIHLMNNVKRVPYLEDASLQYEAIRLPFEKGEYEMIIALPTGRQTVRNLTEHMKYDDYRRLFDDAGNQGLNVGVDYKIPRMKFSWERSLKEALIERGVKSLFDKADLRNMSEAGDLKVSDIVHATEIDVNEKGAKASAVTGIKFIQYIAPIDPPAPKMFVVKKPFVMMIYHRVTSILLFHGCVYNPVSNS